MPTKKKIKTQSKYSKEEDKSWTRSSGKELLKGIEMWTKNQRTRNKKAYARKIAEGMNISRLRVFNMQIAKGIIMKGKNSAGSFEWKMLNRPDYVDVKSNESWFQKKERRLEHSQQQESPHYSQKRSKTKEGSNKANANLSPVKEIIQDDKSKSKIKRILSSKKRLSGSSKSKPLSEEADESQKSEVVPVDSPKKSQWLNRERVDNETPVQPKDELEDNKVSRSPEKPKRIKKRIADKSSSNESLIIPLKVVKELVKKKDSKDDHKDINEDNNSEGPQNNMIKDEPNIVHEEPNLHNNDVPQESLEQRNKEDSEDKIENNPKEERKSNPSIDIRNENIPKSHLSNSVEDTNMNEGVSPMDLHNRLDNISPVAFDIEDNNVISNNQENQQQQINPFDSRNRDSNYETIENVNYAPSLYKRWDQYAQKTFIIKGGEVVNILDLCWQLSATHLGHKDQIGDNPLRIDDNSVVNILRQETNWWMERWIKEFWFDEYITYGLRKYKFLINLGRDAFINWQKDYIESIKPTEEDIKLPYFKKFYSEYCIFVEGKKLFKMNNDTFVPFKRKEMIKYHNLYPMNPKIMSSTHQNNIYGIYSKIPANWIASYSKKYREDSTRNVHLLIMEASRIRQWKGYLPNVTLKEPKVLRYSWWIIEPGLGYDLLKLKVGDNTLRNELAKLYYGDFKKLCQNYITGESVEDKAIRALKLQENFLDLKGEHGRQCDRIWKGDPILMQFYLMEFSKRMENRWKDQQCKAGAQKQYVEQETRQNKSKSKVRNRKKRSRTSKRSRSNKRNGDEESSKEESQEEIKSAEIEGKINSAQKEQLHTLRMNKAKYIDMFVGNYTFQYRNTKDDITRIVRSVQSFHDFVDRNNICCIETLVLFWKYNLLKGEKDSDGIIKDYFHVIAFWKSQYQFVYHQNVKKPLFSNIKKHFPYKLSLDERMKILHKGMDSYYTSFVNLLKCHNHEINPELFDARAEFSTVEDFLNPDYIDHYSVDDAVLKSNEGKKIKRMITKNQNKLREVHESIFVSGLAYQCYNECETNGTLDEYNHYFKKDYFIANVDKGSKFIAESFQTPLLEYKIGEEYKPWVDDLRIMERKFIDHATVDESEKNTAGMSNLDEKYEFDETTECIKLRQHLNESKDILINL